MGSLLVDERDVRFVLFKQLKVQALCKHEKYAEWSEKILNMLLSEAHTFSEKVLFPLNLEGDKEGARFEKGKVFSVPGTRKAYKDFVEGGWLTPCEDEDLGGQGLPHVVMTATHEMFMAANFPFMCYVNLTHDAAKLIDLFGTDEQRRQYADKMYAGKWTGTMALTEPQAGSDVGALDLKAIPRPDGTYSMVGSKIFITNGEQDVGENIINIVLGRIEGDPSGTKGLSVFIVPKYRLNKDGFPGEPNDIICTGIEHKMGLSASPTASLTFGDKNNCIGYLLGNEREGIKIMFHMINSSRLEVGIWGQGTSSVSYLHALSYAREREQGQSIVKPDSFEQVPIIRHPDIRRLLLMMKAYTEGMRAMIYYCSYMMDQQELAATEDEKNKYGQIVSLLIPVCKAYATEKGVELASHAIQIYGGYGYTREYPVEQFLRDSKVGCLFEGTTGVQGMDFALRKLAMKKGEVFNDFLKNMNDIVGKAREIPGWENHIDQFMKTKTLIAEIPSVFFERSSKGEPFYPFLKATPLLEAAGDLIIAWFLLWGAVISHKELEALFKSKGAKSVDEKDKLIESKADAAYLAGKIQSAKFFMGNILPITDGKINAVKWGDVSAWEIKDKSFSI